MIGAVATISVLEGKEKEFEEIAIKLVESVNLEEEGNLFYRLYKKNSNTYIIMEGYKDKESLDYHITTSHYKKYGKAMAEFLDGRPEVVIMDELAPNK